LESLTTVVLPVHNAERTLRPAVIEILDLIETTPYRLHLVIVDDGSTDGTYEMACELASQFPQVSILRQPRRRGLGSALDEVRHRFSVRDVIAHDGVGPIDVDQLIGLLAAPGGYAFAPAEAPEGRGSRRFGAVAALNARLAEAHRAVTSCHWLRFHEPLAPRRQKGAFVHKNDGDSLFAPAGADSANTCTSAHLSN
jgi:hypothetical protein